MESGTHLIVSRYRQLLLQKPSLNPTTIGNWLDTLDANGQWPDIDYADTQPAAWKTSDHLVRLAAFCRVLADPKAPLANDPRLPDAVSRALSLWIDKRYKNANWWHNDIGVPMLMRDIIVLMGTRLQGDQRRGALEVLNQYGRPTSGGGANTIWEAELGLEYGALTGDSALIERYSKMIADEIKISKGEGIQSDWSFHQHSARLQQFHYGGAFLADGARLGWQLNGTPWAMPTEKLQLLANYVLNGSQWMQRGIYTVPGTLDRSVSRPGALRSGDMGTALRQLSEALPARAAELNRVLAREEGDGASLVGYRSFPDSDFSTFHRPGFSFFLKTVSSRSLLTEINTNRENLKGHELSNGDHYLLRDGQEYFNLQPVWNWDLLPGVTWGNGIGAIQRMPFVGSIDDGESGATAMDYRFGTAEKVSLSARKFWACHGDTVVALIGDLQAPGATGPVRTAIDQSLLRGPVTVGDENGKIQSLPPGSYQIKARWIYHNGLAYLPLNGQKVTLQLGPVTGSWHDINLSGSPEPVTQNVFFPILEQGVKPEGQSNGYVMTSARSAAEVEKIAAAPTWHIVKNDSKCQAVRFDDGITNDGTLMATFWQAGALSDGPKILFSVDKPCLLMVSGGQIRACDPTQDGGIITVTSGEGKSWTIVLPAGGVSSFPILKR